MTTIKSLTEIRYTKIDLSDFGIKPAEVLTPAHHIVVVDRSGSMYSDITHARDMLIQTFATATVLKPHVKVSLLSFSSEGDLTSHFEKVPATDVSDPKYVSAIKSIHATALTCISQGMLAALKLVTPAEPTAITLLTDGYANDRSPSTEIAKLNAFVEEARIIPGLFVNCIGFRSWCDWNLMQKIASNLGGKCGEAKTFLDVHKVLFEVNTALSGNVSPIISIGQPDAEGTLLAVCLKPEKVVMAKKGKELILPFFDTSLGDIDKIIQVFNITPKGAESYKKAAKFTNTLKADNAEEAFRVLAAYASALVGSRELRLAKELLFLSGNKSLYEEYCTAITPLDLVGMQMALEEWAYIGSTHYTMGKNMKPKLTLSDLEKLLSATTPHLGFDFEIDTDKFWEVYTRRSTSRVEGTVNEHGEHIPLQFELYATNAPQIRGLSINTSEATIQVETVSPALVRDKTNGQTLMNCEGVSLMNLKSYRSFTLMSSGAWNIRYLPVKPVNRAGTEKLCSMFPDANRKSVDVGDSYLIDLKKFNAVNPEATATWAAVQAAASSMAVYTANIKFYSAMLSKADASPFSEKQVSELKRFYLTPALYWSPPTVEKYKIKDADGGVGLDHAIKTGKVDMYTRFSVSFGTNKILTKDEFPSANEFLAKFYFVTEAGGAKIAKPKVQDLLQGGKFELKPFAENRMSHAHKLMKAVLENIDFGKIKQSEIATKLKGFEADRERAYSELQGITLYIGCLGMLPEELEAEGVVALTGEELEQKTGGKLSKDERNGMFFMLSNGHEQDGGEYGIIGVTPSNAYFSR
jgi:hypothetical protein